MEREHAVSLSDPVEKLLERSRAAEQLMIFVQCVVQELPAMGETRAVAMEAHTVEVVRRDVPLLRATAKYLLTACDRLRRAALQDAWRQLRQAPIETVKPVLDEARLWDATMRELSLQHGVVHPLSEMVTPLTLAETDLARLGLPWQELLNGEDLLAS